MEAPPAEAYGAKKNSRRGLSEKLDSLHKDVSHVAGGLSTGGELSSLSALEQVKPLCVPKSHREYDQRLDRKDRLPTPPDHEQVHVRSSRAQQAFIPNHLKKIPGLLCMFHLDHLEYP